MRRPIQSVISSMTGNYWKEFESRNRDGSAALLFDNSTDFCGLEIPSYLPTNSSICLLLLACYHCLLGAYLNLFPLKLDVMSI